MKFIYLKDRAHYKKDGMGHDEIMFEAITAKLQNFPIFYPSFHQEGRTKLTTKI